MKYLTFYLLLICLSLNAQSNFISGSITLKSNETKVGLINYKDWKVSPEFIEFKIGEEVLVYKPEDLKRFEVQGDKFISRLASIDMTEQKFQKLNSRTEVNYIEKEVFMNVLVEGQLSLYQYYNSRPLYFVQKDDKLTALIFRNYYKDNDSDLFSLKKYIGQLGFLSKECASLKVSENLAYKAKDLTNFILKYNLCTQKGNATELSENYSKDTSKSIRSGFYVSGGYLLSNFSHSSEQFYLKYFEGGKLSTPHIGVAYEIAISKGLDRWSLYNELSYHSYSGSFKGSSQNPPEIYDPFNLSWNTLGLAVGMRYKFNKTGLKYVPFINMSIDYNTVFSQDAFVTGTTTFRSREIPVKLSRNNSGVSFGFGMKYQRFVLEFRANLISKIYGPSTTTSRLTNFGLIGAYKL